MKTRMPCNARRLMKDRLAPGVNAPTNYPRALITYVRDFAEQEREAMGRSAKREGRHFSSLSAVLDLLGRLDWSDPRVIIAADISGELRQIRRRQGEELEGEFEATPGQRRLLSSVGGAFSSAPLPEDFLGEFLAVGLRDLIDRRRKDQGANRSRLRALERQLEDSQTELEQARGEISRLVDQGEQLEAAREEIAEHRKTIETLRDYVGNRPDEDAADAELTGQVAEEAPPLPDLEAVFDAVEVRVGHELTDEEIAAVDKIDLTAKVGESVDEIADRFVEDFKGRAAKAVAAKSKTSKGR